MADLLRTPTRLVSPTCSKQRFNTIWEIDASLEEILLKSTSSSSIKRKKTRNFFCVSPANVRVTYSIDCTPNTPVIVEKSKRDYPFLSSPLFEKSNDIKERILCSSPIRRSDERISKRPTSRRNPNPIRIGSKSDLFVENAKHSKRNRKGASVHENIEPSKIKIRHKDQAIAQVYLSISSEWCDDISSFFHVCLRTLLKEAKIAYKVVPGASISPFKAVLYRELDKYSKVERSSIWIDPSCQKCREGNESSLMDAGASFLFVTSEEFCEMSTPGLMGAIDRHDLCVIHRRITLVLLPKDQQKKKANLVVFPDPSYCKHSEQIQRKILEMQLTNICQILDWKSGSISSLGAMIIELVRTVAFEPFRIKSLGEALSSTGRKGREQKEIFRKMLLLINGVSEAVAIAIVGRWASLGTLIRYLREREKNEGLLAASLALAEIDVQRPKSIKNIGSTLSQRIFGVLMGLDPEVKFS